MSTLEYLIDRGYGISGGSANLHFYQQILGVGGKKFWLKMCFWALSQCIKSEFSLENSKNFEFKKIRP